jgi:zinc and cadmium transporter
MSQASWLALYSLLILLFSLSGGYLPFLGRVTHGKLQFYLTASAGVMLGASFFHVMPEAMELSGPYFGWWMALAVVGLFCIERFIAPHSHEMDGNGHAHNNHDHEHHHDHGPEHKHDHAAGHQEPRAAAPAIAGWMAVLGLTIHTFMNGFSLAGDVHKFHSGVTASKEFLGFVMPPGFSIFLAIFLHKPADALAISMVLSRKGVSRRVITLVQLGFAAMIPLGALAFHAALYLTKKTADLDNQLTGAALAFSAGTFLFIALSDLLPEVQFHRHDRFWLFLTLVLGVAFMGGIAYLEPHDEEKTPKSEEVQPAAPADTHLSAGSDQ